jgi:two-component system nitrogen regulation response regulator NtrX
VDVPVIDLKHLPAQITGNRLQSALLANLTIHGTLKEARNEFEKSFILEKLEENQWNVSKTAEAIGIERSNLHRKIKSLDIDTKRLKGD